MTIEACPALAPVEFFALEGELPYVKGTPTAKQMRKNCLLPKMGEWLGEETFADVAISWNETGLFVHLFVEKPFEEAAYPKFTEGDAFELFCDTRDLKEAGFPTRFCHQFLFLPQPVQGIQAQEITRFRTEDTHPLCEAEDLEIKAVMGKKEYTLELFIPANCLHGFDPASFDRIGLTYRIHRHKGTPQHFALSSQHFSLEQHPRLWASFRFVK